MPKLLMKLCGALSRALDDLEVALMRLDVNNTHHVQIEGCTRNRSRALALRLCRITPSATVDATILHTPGTKFLPQYDDN